MWSRRSAIERCRSSATAQLCFVHHLYNKIAVAEERHRSIADRQLHMFYAISQPHRGKFKSLLLLAEYVFARCGRAVHA